MNPLLGLIYHAIGGFAAGSFYIPYNKVKNWAWEVYWLAGGIFAWIISPLVVAYIAAPDLFQLINSIPINVIIWPYIFGVLWGIGGLTFGLTMRYLGMSLGMALSLGLTAIFGTLIPPIYFEQFGDLIVKLSGITTIGGVVVSIIGIAIVGKAGLLKDKELSDNQKKEVIKEFNLKKGVWVAIIAGIMSACFAFGIAAGRPLADLAMSQGTPVLFSNSPTLIFILLGGFTTNFIYCITISIKNKTFGDYIKTKETPIFKNYLYSALAGIIWYLQFMFYGMGTTKLGEYDFASWSIHMAFIIIFSNMWGLILNEWQGSGKRTIRYILLGLLVLTLSTIIIGLGNYMQQFE